MTKPNDNEPNESLTVALDLQELYDLKGDLYSLDLGCPRLRLTEGFRKLLEKIVKHIEVVEKEDDT